MQYLNLFGKRELPRPLQQALTWFANRVPVIMWRVFTPDVTNFFVRIYRIDRASGERTPIVHEDTTYSYRDRASWRRSLRFLHVTESIAFTTVFTTIKYFRSQRELFESRLRAYAATLGDNELKDRVDWIVLPKHRVALNLGRERFASVTQRLRIRRGRRARGHWLRPSLRWP